MDKNTQVEAKPIAKTAFSSRVEWNNKKYSTKRLVITMTILVLTPILVVVAVHFIQGGQKNTRSKNLVSNITHLKKSVGCDDGIKQLSSIGSQLDSSSQYTNSAKESALSYLVDCEIGVGNTKQGLVYADQLDKLYAQEGNNQKRQQLAQKINYIKSFGTQ